MSTTLDDFASLAGWTNGGGVSLSPAGWAYHPGNGVGTGHLTKLIPATENVYCEAKVYNDQNSGNWFMMKMNSQNSNLYNTAAGDGFGVYFGGNGGLNAFVGGTVTHTGWNGAYTIPTLPLSAAAALTVGIHKISSTVFDVYVNRVKVGRTTTTQAVTGTRFDIGGYNGAGSHIDYFMSSDRLWTPYDTTNAPAKVSF